MLIMKRKKRVIGLTGSLSSGKTTAAREFAALGATVIDADAIAHELLDKDADIQKEITEIFGTEVMVSGAVNREKLASIVFFNKELLGKLCGIMHPKIISRIKKAVDEAPGDVVVDAPLLFESGLDKQTDMSIVVNASEKTCLKRAVSRGMPEKTARAIMDSQMSSEEKVKRADYVIENEKSVEKLKEGVKKVWQKK